ncbi:hypothetical protein ACFU6S_27440 [Streptomyces sp. NPDC057456]|uniref:hypothetical protein n=1 Tax=Streptomyces sp. NPDC057456 TaxID=3346139 RepID=UPI0036A12276
MLPDHWRADQTRTDSCARQVTSLRRGAADRSRAGNRGDQAGLLLSVADPCCRLLVSAGPTGTRFEVRSLGIGDNGWSVRVHQSRDRPFVDR